jgi:hypothetical protein
MTHGKNEMLFERARGKIGADPLPPLLMIVLRGKNA